MLTLPPVGLEDVVRAILGLPLVKRSPGSYYAERMAELKSRNEEGND